MGKGQELYKKAKQLIPDGTQLLSKRPKQFLPEQWPAYYEKAKGCEILNLDGKKYIDMSFMGIGACTLGYADDDVDNAVIDCIKNGSMITLNCPEEVTLAKKLIELHPWAEMVRYARGGGDGVSVAVRIARKATLEDVGIRPGEKLLEEMITSTDALNTIDLGKYYAILSLVSYTHINEDYIKHHKAVPVPFGFHYSSDINTEWETVESLREKIVEYCDPNFEVK